MCCTELFLHNRSSDLYVHRMCCAASAADVPRAVTAALAIPWRRGGDGLRETEGGGASRLPQGLQPSPALQDGTSAFAQGVGERKRERERGGGGEGGGVGGGREGDRGTSRQTKRQGETKRGRHKGRQTDSPDRFLKKSKKTNRKKETQRQTDK